MSTKTKPTATPQQAAFDTVAQLTRDQIERANAWADELAHMESAMYDHAKELMDYGATLSAEWRRLVLESTRKTADLMSSKA